MYKIRRVFRLKITLTIVDDNNYKFLTTIIDFTKHRLINPAFPDFRVEWVKCKAVVVV